jgi:hypothetical protein
MAILKMLGRTGGIGYELTPLKLLSVMLFPDDEVAGKQWLAAAALSAPRSVANPGDEISTSLEILKMICAAPASEELMREADERALHGKVAANILWLVLSLASSAPEHATVRKAIRVMGIHSARNGKNGVSVLPRDTTTIKRIWSRFKPVSHLWAAIQYQSANLNNISQSIGALIGPENLPNVLAVAEEIRVRAENHRPPGGSANSRPLKVSTLDPENTWKPPANLVLPVIRLKLPIPPKWALKELRSYRVDR